MSTRCPNTRLAVFQAAFCLAPLAPLPVVGQPVTAAEAGARQPGDAPGPAADAGASAPSSAAVGADRAETGAPIGTLSTVVVTGTGTPVSQLKAPYAISAFSRDQLDRLQPRSTVDLLRSVPGYWAEPSGGKGGGENLYVRGLPDGGWYNVQLLQDGLPIFDEPQTSFMNIDVLNRFDISDRSVEVVTGGTSPLYANNAPGGTLNVIPRRGTANPEGAVRVTYGSHDLKRVEGYQSGPLTDRLRYVIGGYARTDNGDREPGYTADRGGQVRGGLSMILDRGRVDVDLKVLDDHNAFFGPIPLADPRQTSVSLAGQIDPLSGTIQSDAFRTATLRSFDGNQSTASTHDLGDGIHTRMTQFSAKLQHDLGDGGWSVTDTLRYNHANVGYDYIASGANPTDATTYLATQLARAKTGFGSQVTRVGYTIAGNPSAPQDPTAGNGLVLESTWTSAQTTLRNVVNDLRLNGVVEAAGTHDITLGAYIDDYTLSQNRLPSVILTSVQNRPAALDVVAYDASGAVVGTVTQDGFVRYGNGVLRGSVSGKYMSAYASDSWKATPQWTLDAGVRETRLIESGTTAVTGTRNLGDPTTLADDNVGGFTGATLASSQRHNAFVWSLGSAYAVNTSTNAFLRYTHSQRLPRTQDAFNTTPAVNPTTSIQQAEGGVRFGSEALSVSSIAYWSAFNRVNFSALVLNPQTGNLETLGLLGQTRTFGLENAVNWRMATAFGLAGTLTLQDPRTRSLATPGGVSGSAYDGKLLPRIPQLLYSVQPTTYFALGPVPIEVSATAYHTGRRYVDYANSTALPAYTSYDAAIVAHVAERTTLSINGSNLSNVRGLTEGNPRTDVLNGQGTPTPIYGRPIFGRAVQASLTYAW